MALSTDVPLLSKLRCESGTESDWQRFYANYRGMILKWCSQSGVVPSDLDDVFHDVLIKLVDALPSYDPSLGNRFRSWLKTVVMNALIDRLRFSKNNPFPRLMADSDLNKIHA